MRRALVTGAARGIGLAIAERLRQDGLEVITPSRAELDLSKVPSIEAFLKDSGDLEVEVLVNNAAENVVRPLQELPLADFQRVLTTNLTAAFLLTQAVARHMTKVGWGRVVNVSSCYAFLSRAGRGAYATSKAGLGGLTRTAALELGPRGVLVNAVAPGFVDTELTRRNNPPAKVAELAAQTALGRLAQPEEVAELVAFLCSDRNSYLTGQTLVIDAGFSIQ